MENNDKYKFKKNAVLATILALAMLTSACSELGDDVTVTLKEKKVEEEVKPKIEVKEEATWAQYDETVLMYKVDFDKYLTDKLKLSKKVLQNSDVINLIEIIHEELGKEFYTKEKDSNTLYNLDGKSVTVGAYYTGYQSQIYVKFYGEENSLVYETEVIKNGTTHTVSRSREEGVYNFSKYFVIYSDNKEFTRTICLRESKEKYLIIDLHEGGLGDSYTISFDTNMGEASIKLSKEEYDVLHEIMLSYSDSDNLYKFLSDNADLLNKYLDMVKEKNAEYYEHLCSLINEYIEESKILRYE